MEPTSYNKLIVYQKANDLAYEIYQATNYFPKDELHGITSQMRRASTSVAANIVEGYLRNTPKEKIRFMNIAHGSLIELEYFIQFSRRLGYLKRPQYEKVVSLKNDVGKLLFGYTKAIKTCHSLDTGYRRLETVK